jgi:RNA polymerase sigma factor (sigma-70 family)
VIDEQELITAQRKARGMVTAILGPRYQDSVDDILQQAALQVVRSIDTFRRECSLSTFLYVCAKRLTLMYLRDNRRDHHVLSISTFFEDGENFEHEFFTDRSLESKIIARNLLNSLLVEIPEKHARVLIKRYVLGFTAKEIGNQSGRRVEAVKGEGFRAIRRLRERREEIA